MAIQVVQGGEYRGETYIFCDRHETEGHNNGQGWGAIFEGDNPAALYLFISQHSECP